MAPCPKQKISPVGSSAGRNGEARQLPYGSSGEPVHRVSRDLRGGARAYDVSHVPHQQEG